MNGNFRERLIEKIKQKKSVVCVGLDPDLYAKQFPIFLVDRKNPKLEFAKAIIDEVADIVPIIKPNTRFYMVDEYKQLQEIVNYAHNKDLEVIGDCKENDIGSTMGIAYEKQFHGYDFDAITVNPYFGSDGIVGDLTDTIFKHWYEEGKGLFVLIKTSNKSSSEIQDLHLQNAIEFYDEKNNTSYYKLYFHVASLVERWSSNYDYTIGGIFGATHPSEFSDIRKIFSGILLIPGYGAQGGKGEDIKNAVAKNKFSIVNSSRGIMYAYSMRFKKFQVEDFAKAARKEVIFMNEDINKYIRDFLV